MPIAFTLSYDGQDADRGRIEFYDVAQALVGFQRSLALTTHMVINGEVITQAPSLKNAEIFVFPPEDGSWKIVATILGGLFIASQAPQNSALGHLMTSAYDYIISESLGFHVDFNKTLGQQRRSRLDLKPQPPSKFDAVIEKCDVSIRNMHRPIVYSHSAESASITCHADDGRVTPLTAILTRTTYEYISFTREAEAPITFVGRVSSYNMNTFKGRIFSEQEWRPIPFELTDFARSRDAIELITTSLAVNARSRNAADGNITCTAFRNTSRSGQLKSYRIIKVEL
jgi:hypothetical protein